MTVINLITMDSIKELRLRGLHTEAKDQLKQYHISIKEQREEDKRNLRKTNYLKAKQKEQRSKSRERQGATA